jgi:regulatory protein
MSASESDGRLARVSYLPGVLPPSDGPSEHETPAAPAAPSEKARRRAENVSMNALTRRGMSRRELERVLLARELDEVAVAAELERLQGVGLIDDRALGYDLVSRLRDRKGLGRTAVAAELARRLLPNDVITEVLDSIESDDELETARELAVRRAAQLRSLDRATAERRLSGFLQRRGYSGDIVRTAVTEALASPGGAPSGVTFR